MRGLWTFALGLMLWTLTQADASAGKRVALVIGNSAYRNVTPLNNARNDANLMAGTLRDLGFELVGGAAQLDLDKAALDNAVRGFGGQLQGAEVGLFYYAGHGVQVRGANYLVPVGANPTRESDVDFELVDVLLVMRQMEASGTRLNLVVLDACRNNPFGGRGLRATEPGLAQMRAPEGTLISFATQPGAVARDGTDGNSPYTKALAQTIRRPGLGIFDAINEVGLTVKRVTGGEQQPWFSTSPIDGNFYFVAQPIVATPGTNTAPTLDPAERAWSVIQNTTSIAVLEDFIRQFGITAYGSMARARLDELKKSQVAFTIPPPRPDASPKSNELDKSANNLDWILGTWCSTYKGRPIGEKYIFKSSEINGEFVMESYSSYHKKWTSWKLRRSSSESLDWIGADTKSQFRVSSSHAIALSAWKASYPLVRCQ